MYDHLIFAILIYILIISTIFITKPELIYDYKNKIYKDFGFNNNKTYLPLPVLCCLLAVISYLIGCFIIEMVDNDTF